MSGEVGEPSAATLPIACAITDAYMLPLMVMLRSIRRQLRPGVRPVLYLMHTGLAADALAAVAGTMETHPIVPTPAQLASAVSDTRFPVEASFPLIMPDLLPPTVERALFLDADLFVLGDLAELWATRLEPDAVLAAVGDGAIPRCAAPRGVKGCQALGIPADAPYFNGGVLLVDLDRWRSAGVTRRALAYLDATRHAVDFLHQEALNAVLWQAWQPLPRRWNLLSSQDCRTARPNDVRDSESAGIVHFAGRVKPWRVPVGGPFNAPYQAVLAHVREGMPPVAAGPKDRLLSLYDRYLRDSLYPFERALWEKGLI